MYQIGNYVKSGNKIYEVTAITKNGLEKIEINGMEYLAKHAEINPIPLTEQWLLKLFFNKEYQKGYIGIDVHNSDFVLTEPKIMGEWQEDYAFQFSTGYLQKFKEIKYVHELQNLFLALTGKELILQDVILN